MIMKLNNFYKQSKANQNYLVELIAFLLMIITGLIMLIYHITENDFLLILGIPKNSWLLSHKISSCIALSFVIIHLVQHVDWIKKLFTFKLKNKFKRLNTALFIVFLLTVFTAIFSWLIFPDTNISNGLKGIHSKLGFLCVILFFFHIKNYFTWIKRMTLKFINFK